MKLNLKNIIKAVCFSIAVFAQVKCSSSNDAVENPPVIPPVVVTNDVDFWLTKGDQGILLAKQSSAIGFGITNNSFATIEVNESQKYQTVDGFGYTLTGGS